MSIGLILVGCSDATQLIINTPTTVLPTLTATTTISWFPATSTRTPLPTLLDTPTPEILPGLSDLLFSDHFNQPTLWDLSPSDGSSSIISGNRLTMSIPGGANQVNLTSLRKDPILNDFYASIAVHLSLCKAKDQYNLLFRLTSNMDFYRFSAACTGEVRLERVVAGKPFVIKDWLTSPDAPLGAPGEVKLGVWASGRDLRFYLNDHFQFSVNDGTFPQGSLGVSIRPDSQDSMTVGFSNLDVYTLEPLLDTPSPPTTLTATPSRTPVH